MLIIENIFRVYLCEIEGKWKEFGDNFTEKKVTYHD